MSGCTSFLLPRPTKREKNTWKGMEFSPDPLAPLMTTLTSWLNYKTSQDSRFLLRLKTRPNFSPEHHKIKKNAQGDFLRWIGLENEAETGFKNNLFQFWKNKILQKSFEFFAFNLIPSNQISITLKGCWNEAVPTVLNQLHLCNVNKNWKPFYLLRVIQYWFMNRMSQRCCQVEWNFS